MSTDQDFTLTRTGRAPLSFRGQLIAEKREREPREKRWHELAIYRTVGGKYVVHIAYKTEWRKELGNDFATVTDNPAACADVLAWYNPLAYVVGYPPGDVYKERQERFLAEVTARYRAHVSELLASSPEFTELID